MYQDRNSSLILTLFYRCVWWWYNDQPVRWWCEMKWSNIYPTHPLFIMESVLCSLSCCHTPHLSPAAPAVAHRAFQKTLPQHLLEFSGSDLTTQCHTVSTLFICGVPCQLYGFKQCSGVLIFRVCISSPKPHSGFSKSFWSYCYLLVWYSYFSLKCPGSPDSPVIACSPDMSLTERVWDDLDATRIWYV